MRGRHTLHSLKKRLAALCMAAATIISIGWVGTPALAHAPSNWEKERAHVKKRVRSQLGTPYVYGGGSSSGFDCSGLTSWVYGRHGASLPHSSLLQFKLASTPAVKRIWKRSNLEIGDLVFHKTTSARVGHVGIYVGKGRFISSTSSGGVRVRSIRDPYYWGPRWVGGTRLPATIRYR
ncbi:MAG: C40 family peptidase [Actinobacteria bacterium]|nr:C40 family peptidase [Actinomycetota bacterium]